MSDDPYASRRGLTFNQAEGIDALPAQLELRTISPELSATLWLVVHSSLSHCIIADRYAGGSYRMIDPWRSILFAWWITQQHQNVDELPDPRSLLQMVKVIVTSRNYSPTFNFLQFVIQRPDSPPGFARDIGRALENARAAYRVVDDLIVPIATDEEAEAVAAALAEAQRAEAQGPHAHLREAARLLSAGDAAASVRESIHAVEAAAKFLEPKAATLGDALPKLERKGVLNPRLKDALVKLYSYTNDEKGVRHALVFDGKPNITERDAIFMFGSCAAFVSYLLSAARE